MQTAVKKFGNSLAVQIPNSIAENLNLKDDTKLDIKTYKGKIILTKKENLSELSEQIKQINENNLNIDEPYKIKGKEW